MPHRQPLPAQSPPRTGRTGGVTSKKPRRQLQWLTALRTPPCPPDRTKDKPRKAGPRIPNCYSSSGGLGQQKLEFKEMVRAFHIAGIEVILDVVFNHTAEGDELGPTLCFRGMDK